MYCFDVESKRFKLDLRVVHMRDLNFILWFEIFVHFDRQLWAMHLILDCNPVYTTWQPFKLALLADSLLLSYIYVRHTNFLLPSLTIGKARNLGPRYTTAEDLAPLRDKSAKRVSQSHKVHVPIEEPEDPA